MSTGGGSTTAGGGGGQHGHRRQESMYAMTGLYSEPTSDGEPAQPGPSVPPPPDTLIKCHSRNPSSGIVDK